MTGSCNVYVIKSFEESKNILSKAFNKRANDWRMGFLDNDLGSAHPRWDPIHSDKVVPMGREIDRFYGVEDTKLVSRCEDS